MEDKELLKLSIRELNDMGVCPTCFNQKMNGEYFGNPEKLLVYSDADIECSMCPNPRAKGHMIILSKKHYHDMVEAPDELNQKIIVYAKQLMKIITEVYGCVRVYYCTMCDGPANHYHVQLIPRYKEEERGSINFVKTRQEYEFDEVKFNLIKTKLNDFIKNNNID